MLCAQPPNADELFERALRLQQSGNWKSAEQSYRSYVKQFGPKAEVLANLGAVLVRQERFTEAIQSYRDALRLAPQLLPLRLNLGLAHFKAGQLAPAAEQFTLILDKEPGHTQARQLRAICNFELERFEAAAEDYLKLMPSGDANIRIGLASSYLRLKRYRESQQIIDSLIDSDSAPVKLLLGQMHIENGQWEQAVPVLKRALELDPKIQTAHLSLGAVYWQQNDQAAAIEEWRKEVASHPDSFQGNYSLGAGLALSEGRAAEAEKHLRKAIALKPGNAMALYQLAKLVWQTAKNQESITLLRRSIAADRNYQRSHYLLGTIYQSLGRKEEAAREFAEVKRITAADLNRSVELFESVK